MMLHVPIVLGLHAALKNGPSKYARKSYSGFDKASSLFDELSKFMGELNKRDSLSETIGLLIFRRMCGCRRPAYLLFRFEK